MLNDLVGQAFERFIQSNKPLDPPLLLVIDEAATLRPDQLPSWASTLSGIGVQLVTAWQSVSQIEAAYGKQSQAVLTNHLTKLFFAGMSDAAGLDYLSRLLGDEHVPSRLSSQSGYVEGDRQSVTGVPLVPPAAPDAAGRRPPRARDAPASARSDQAVVPEQAASKASGGSMRAADGTGADGADRGVTVPRPPKRGVRAGRRPLRQCRPGDVRQARSPAGEGGIRRTSGRRWPRR